MEREQLLATASAITRWTMVSAWLAAITDECIPFTGALICLNLVSLIRVNVLCNLYNVVMPERVGMAEES